MLAGVCVFSSKFFFLCTPPFLSIRLACYPLAWGRVWQRDNPCGCVLLTLWCSCLLRLLQKFGHFFLFSSLSPFLSFCYKYISQHMVPQSAVQHTERLCLLVRHTEPLSLWKWFALLLWLLHYLGHCLLPTRLDQGQVCVTEEWHTHSSYFHSVVLRRQVYLTFFYRRKIF